MTAAGVTNRAFGRDKPHTHSPDRSPPLPNQSLLLLAPQPLYRILPAHGLFLRLKSLIIRQFHRPAPLRILRALARIMVRKPFLQIIRPSRIETAVPALQNICIIHTHPSPLILSPHDTLSAAAEEILPRSSLYIKQSHESWYLNHIEKLNVTYCDCGFSIW